MKEGEGEEEESSVFTVCLLSESLENEPRGSGHQQSHQQLLSNKNAASLMASINWLK